ncbi:MAG: hypothetical protein M1823_003808 [Watsoniomyces obsoletus]|nr:MAG: hypothetical protein M1823_003808 [Watsoniomyces obsoletus]
MPLVNNVSTVPRSPVQCTRPVGQQCQKRKIEDHASSPKPASAVPKKFKPESMEEAMCGLRAVVNEMKEDTPTVKEHVAIKEEKQRVTREKAYEQTITREKPYNWREDFQRQVALKRLTQRKKIGKHMSRRRSI